MIELRPFQRAFSFLKAPYPTRLLVLKIYLAQCFAVLLTLPAEGQDSVGIVNEIQDNLARALELRQMRAKEVDEWKKQKPQLDGLISVTKVDNEVLEDQLAELKNVIEGYAERLAEAEKDLEENQALLESVKLGFGAFDEDFEAMVAVLPERLRERGLHLMDQTRERTQYEDVASIRKGTEVYLQFLAEVVAFDRKTHAFSELRAMSDGRRVEFTVIHFGLGATFFLSEEQGVAGRIRLKDSEWVWEENANLLDGLRKAKRMLDGKQEPAFIPLPLAVSKEAAQ